MRWVRRSVVAAAVAVPVLSLLAPTAAHAASPPAAGPAVSAAATGLSDTCTALRKQLRTLAARGQRHAMCTAPLTGAAAAKVRADATRQAQARRADGGAFALSPTCQPNQDFATRFEICRSLPAVTNVVEIPSGNVVGQIFYTLVSDIVMNPNTKTFAENFDAIFTFGVNNIAGMFMSVTVTCGFTCVAASPLTTPQPVFVGADVLGVFTYQDFTPAIDTTNSTYTATFTKFDALPGTLRWNSATYRCDQVIGISGGCVNPNAIPTLTTMVNLPNIAANIRNVQSAGPHHYGRIFFGSPVHRNSSLADINRAVACPSSRVPPGPDLSCDEYPFATTSEGASRSSFPDWGWAWVPVSEQNSQGGYLSSFYQGQRVLEGDAYWVQV